jgi:hypothetical protein
MPTTDNTRGVPATDFDITTDRQTMRDGCAVGQTNPVRFTLVYDVTNIGTGLDFENLTNTDGTVRLFDREIETTTAQGVVLGSWAAQESMALEWRLELGDQFATETFVFASTDVHMNAGGDPVDYSRPRPNN